MKNNTVFVGAKFGRLTVIRLDGVRKYSDGSSVRLWICQCACGNESKPLRTCKLSAGKVNSCGCIRKEQVSARNTKGNNGSILRAKGLKQSSDPLYRKWRSMHHRCQSEVGYLDRGITVCDEWMNFPAFKTWAISAGFQDYLSLDRIDNDGGYSPDNCQWADMVTQANNRRSNVFLTLNEETKTLAQWSRDPRCVLKRDNFYRKVREAKEDPISYFNWGYLTTPTVSQ